MFALLSFMFFDYYVVVVVCGYFGCCYTCAVFGWLFLVCVAFFLFVWFDCAVLFGLVVMILVVVFAVMLFDCFDCLLCLLLAFWGVSLCCGRYLLLGFC